MATETEDLVDLILHHLVIKGRATAAALAEATGRETAAANTALAVLMSDGAVVEKTGRLSGFAPTSEGRARAQRRAAESGLYQRRDELGGWYDDGFAPLNSEFKALCTAWQMRAAADGPTPNDHTDAEYDRRILVQLGDFHERAHAHLRSAHHPRIDRYAARLESALNAVRAGDTARFAAPLRDSYHDIWMELHQDLLLSLQRTRTADDA